MLPWTFVYKFLYGQLLSVFLWVELQCYMVMLQLMFWRTTKLFSKAVAPFYIPTNNVCEFQSLYILTRLVIVRLLGYNHPNGYEVTSHCHFDSHFPDGQWNWAFFPMFTDLLDFFPIHSFLKRKKGIILYFIFHNFFFFTELLL